MATPLDMKRKPTLAVTGNPGAREASGTVNGKWDTKYATHLSSTCHECTVCPSYRSCLIPCAPLQDIFGIVVADGGGHGEELVGASVKLHDAVLAHDEYGGQEQ
eukprot:7224873-Alexandrium_andersonii.AAC.2